MIKHREIGKQVFTNSDTFAVYSLPRSTNHILLSGPISNQINKEGSFIIQRFDKEDIEPLFIEAEKIELNGSFLFENDEISYSKSTPIDEYMHYVNKTIESIRDGLFRKVVLSKVKVIEAKNGLESDCYEVIFNSLKHLYPDAFVFLYHVSGQGCWCGATPEILMEFNEDICTTMALAGTQKDRGLPLDEVEWGAKEIDEQRIIEEYVEDVLMKSGINSIKIGPDTTRAGSVLHLKSVYKMGNVIDPIKLGDSLHPGPAICGIPQIHALDWIKKYEGHSRAHYCGYIGPWNIENASALYINLRSMQMFKNQFNLFLGGGLTAESDAQSEWQETELKANTLLAGLAKTAING